MSLPRGQGRQGPLPDDRLIRDELLHGGVSQHTLGLEMSHPHPQLGSEAKRGGTERNCGDIRAACLYAIPADGHIPARNPWPSVQRRNSPPGASAEAQGRLVPRPGALFMYQPQTRMRAERRPRRGGLSSCCSRDIGRSHRTLAHRALPRSGYRCRCSWRHRRYRQDDRQSAAPAVA